MIATILKAAWQTSGLTWLDVIVEKPVGTEGQAHVRVELDTPDFELLPIAAIASAIHCELATTRGTLVIDSAGRRELGSRLRKGSVFTGLYYLRASRRRSTVRIYDINTTHPRYSV